MLVLSRRESQRIRLGDSIVVTVVRVSGDRVRPAPPARPYAATRSMLTEPVSWVFKNRSPVAP